MQAQHTDCERFHRRDFLKAGTAGLLGLGLADLLRAEASPKKQKAGRATGVIMVWLAGGPSTIDIWDLKPDAPENVRGEFRPIKTSAPDIQIGEHLPRLARTMDRVTLIRSLHHSIPVHGPGTVYMTTGNLPSAALTYPSLGALASRTLGTRKGIPAHVNFRGSGVPGTTGYLGAAHGPFEVGGDPARGTFRVEGVALPDGFTPKDLDDRARLRERFDARFRAIDRSAVGAGLDRFQQEALDILRSDRTRKAFDLAGEKGSVRESYGRGVGQMLLAARRLIEAGARFVTVGLGGWDTHAGNFATLRQRLLPQLDQSLSALLSDLAQRRLLDKTVVYCAGEFGRTPLINSAAGRDHWPQSMAVLLAGGGLKRGYVHGSTDRDGKAPACDPCSPDDVAATIFQCLGIGPEQTVPTITGRPVSLFRKGKVITNALA
jgi:Protein of unknown function (DUF1501)